jgi:hypothetical protein
MLWVSPKFWCIGGINSKGQIDGSTNKPTFHGDGINEFYTQKYFIPRGLKAGKKAASLQPKIFKNEITHDQRI